MPRWSRTLLPVLLLSVACSADRAEASLSLTTTGGSTVELRVEVADSPEERRMGLMDRETLRPYDGMAFAWAEPTEATFWMKDTTIPLSIAFWDENGRIVAIKHMDPCERDPCPRYDSGVPVVGAVEVARGTFDELGIDVGDHAELRET